MKAKITVSISEAAQRAALIAGAPSAQEQFYVVPQELLAQLLALPWTEVKPDGSVSCDVPPRIGWGHGDAPPDPRASPYGDLWRGGYADQRPADAAAAIAHGERVVRDYVAYVHERRDERRVELERQDAEARAEVARWCALPLAHRASVHGVGYCRPSNEPDYFGPLHTSGVAVVSLDVVRRYAPDTYAEAEREVKKLREERDAAKAQAEQARLLRLRAIVLDIGPDHARERIGADPGYPLGCLPEDEAVQFVRDHVLPVTDACPAYADLTEADIRAHCDDNCRSCDPSYETVTLQEATLTAADWTDVKAIQAAMAAYAVPDGKVRVHRGQCDRRDCPAWPVTRVGIRVAVDLGDGLVVQREYGAPGGGS
jgi:hypothetical protein